MGEPLLVEYDGKMVHRSVGVWLEYNGGNILLERLKKPDGFGGVAGHVDVGETPLEAFLRETKEESGLDVVEYELIDSDIYLPFDKCRHGVQGHIWDLYHARGEGELLLKADECQGVGIYGRASIEAKLVNGEFEPAWDYLLPEYGLLDRRL